MRCEGIVQSRLFRGITENYCTKTSVTTSDPQPLFDSCQHNYKTLPPTHCMRPVDFVQQAVRYDLATGGTENIILDVAPCSLLETGRRFGSYLHHQGDTSHH
jgi:hypothetical protein